ncbi:hypothetical protein EMIT0194P_200062 [Pseudomonas serbica]
MYKLNDNSYPQTHIALQGYLKWRLEQK